MKQIKFAIVALMVTVLALSGCQSKAAEVELVETPYTDSESGFQIQFPENWWVQGEPGLVVASSTSTMLRGEASLNLSTINAPLIVIRSASAASLGFSTPQSADALINDLEAAASEDATLRFKRTRNQQFGDEWGRYAEFSGSLAGGEASVEGRVYAVVTDRMAATIIAAAPETQWASFQPVLDAIIASARVSGN